MSIENTSRSYDTYCTIDFTNESKSTLLSPSVFMQRGVVADTPPQTLSPSASGSALLRNTTGDPYGAHGVLTYNLKDSSGKLMDKIMALMFHNYMQTNNLFAVGFFDISRACDFGLYDEMCHGDQTTFVRDKAGKTLIYNSQGVNICATMTNTHNSVMAVQIE
ncbi:uncharacterized protein V6R79_008603 [Siganus canaliculatus]